MTAQVPRTPGLQCSHWVAFTVHIGSDGAAALETTNTLTTAEPPKPPKGQASAHAASERREPAQGRGGGERGGEGSESGVEREPAAVLEARAQLDELLSQLRKVWQ